MEKGAFFRFALERFGSPDKCAFKKDGERQKLAYTFPKRATLEAEVDATIEMSRARLVVPGLLEKEAEMLLREAARKEFGSADGCVDWSAPENEDGQKIWRGEDCNCQARMIFKGTKRVVELIVQSAC